MRMLLSLALAFGLIGGGTAAQTTSCADLTVTGDGTPGTSLSFDVTGATASSFFVLFVGPNAGSTTLTIGPLGSLELGLADPFFPMMFGLTDSAGAFSFGFTIPQFRIPAVQLNAQGTTLGLNTGTGGLPSLESCTTDVEAFSVGT